MSKKIIAVTRIKHDGEYIDLGSVLDTSKFTKKQLESLYDNGAIRVEVVENPKAQTPQVIEPEVKNNEGKSE